MLTLLPFGCRIVEEKLQNSAYASWNCVCSFMRWKEKKKKQFLTAID